MPLLLDEGGKSMDDYNEKLENINKGKAIYEKVFKGNKCNIESLFTDIELDYNNFNFKSDADESKVKDDLDKLINYILDSKKHASNGENTQNNIKDDLIKIRTSKSYYQGKFDIAVSNVSLLSFYSTMISILALFLTIIFNIFKTNNPLYLLIALVIFLVLLVKVPTMINSTFTKNAIVYNYCIKYLTYLEEKLNGELSK